MVIEHILFVITILAVCVICVAMLCSQRATGTLKIDHSNPEKDVYRFEIDDLDKLNTKTRIVLKIDHDANLSQK